MASSPRMLCNLDAWPSRRTLFSSRLWRNGLDAKRPFELAAANGCFPPLFPATSGAAPTEQLRRRSQRITCSSPSNRPVEPQRKAAITTGHKGVDTWQVRPGNLAGVTFWRFVTPRSGRTHRFRQLCGTLLPRAAAALVPKECRRHGLSNGSGRPHPNENGGPFVGSAIHRLVGLAGPASGSLARG